MKLLCVKNSRPEDVYFYFELNREIMGGVFGR